LYASSFGLQEKERQQNAHSSVAVSYSVCPNRSSRSSSSRSYRLAGCSSRSYRLASCVAVSYSVCPNRSSRSYQHAGGSNRSSRSY
jgi:hypothetical protein